MTWPWFNSEVRPRLDVHTVFEDVEFTRQTGKQWIGKCPLHDDHKPSFSVRTDTLEWYCFGPCGGGGPVEFIMARYGLDKWGAAVHLAELIGATPGSRSLPPRKRPIPQKPKPDPEPQPLEGTIEVWNAARSVADDPQAFHWLDVVRGRLPDGRQGIGIPPGVVVDRDLARALVTRPPWAERWVDTGHRLLVPMYDHRGQMCMVRGRYILEADLPQGMPKTLNPFGGSPKGLVMANREAVDMLRGERSPERVLIVEGEPDFLRWGTRAGDACEHPDAILGVVAGSWTARLAARIPRNATVIIRTHGDAPGRKYRDAIIDTLPVHRRGGRIEIKKNGENMATEKEMDEDEKGARNLLPDDPADDTEVYRDPRDPKPIRRICDVYQGAVERMARRERGEEKHVPVPDEWGADFRDALGDGFWPGLHMLVAGTGFGKTQWALQLALHAANAGHPALYVALEADDVQLTARLLGFLNDLYWSNIIRGKVNKVEGEPDRIGALATAHPKRGDLNTIPLYIRTGASRGWTDEDLREDVAELVEAHPDQTPLVVIDYLQLLRDDGRQGGESRDIIGRTVYACKDMATEHDAAVLAISSAARTHYKTLLSIDDTGVPAGLVGLGKESGEIEFSADTVMVMVREKDDAWEPVNHRKIRLALAKNRMGFEKWIDEPYWLFDGKEFSRGGGSHTRRQKTSAKSKTNKEYIGPIRKK